MAKVKVNELVLRDAHQSLIATRMTLDEMLPILPVMDEIGYNAVEMWGGATFDSCLRFLDEDPWQRLQTIRKAMPKTKMQMLFRGQNMLGYRHYADDVVSYFVQKIVANGIDIMRIFDALNDPRNLQASINAAKKEGAHVQACIAYTISPVHSNEYFAQYAKQLEEMGADSLCIKDMAGLLTPYATYDLVKKLKETISIPVDIHSHYTSGLASMSIMKGVEAGADIIDSVISPLAMGTSHMATESLVAALQGTEYDTGLDLHKLNEVREFFAKLRQKYVDKGMLNHKVLGVDANTLLYQVPGGMLSNLLNQLKEAGKADLLEDVLAEVPRVREEAGFPPLVTPSSQIVGTQAALNIINGERYKMVTKEFKALVRGEYGKTPQPISDEFRKMIIGDEEPITCRPADLLQPEMDKLREEC
ncbi:MAG: pyruvate carboxylase subunit B, partial [Oscillospiraceae bacterium]|nr:pyruvate carboxylase subunit B [Oscillospiraceae bacterium]